MADMVFDIISKGTDMYSGEIIDFVVQELVDKYGGRSLSWSHYGEEVFDDLMNAKKIQFNLIGGNWLVCGVKTEFPTLRCGYGS